MVTGAVLGMLFANWCFGCVVAGCSHRKSAVREFFLLVFGNESKGCFELERLGGAAPRGFNVETDSLNNGPIGFAKYCVHWVYAFDGMTAPRGEV